MESVGNNVPAGFVLMTREEEFIPPKRTRTIFSKNQLDELERQYAINKYIGQERMDIISTHLNMTVRQVRTWFQNRRRKVEVVVSSTNIGDILLSDQAVIEQAELPPQNQSFDYIQQQHDPAMVPSHLPFPAFLTTEEQKCLKSFENVEADGKNNFFQSDVSGRPALPDLESTTKMVFIEEQTCIAFTSSQREDGTNFFQPTADVMSKLPKTEKLVEIVTAGGEIFLVPESYASLNLDSFLPDLEHSAVFDNNLGHFTSHMPVDYDQNNVLQSNGMDLDFVHNL